MTIFKGKGLGFCILDLFYWVPDVLWLKLLFRVKNGYWMDFKNPKSFNEKLQWLKVYGFHPEYTSLVDKYSVKDYVTKKIGSEYVIPTLGVWNKPEDIDWGRLPNRFVLKTTHGGGSCGVVICGDKNTIDKKKAIDELNVSMGFTVGKAFREHPYVGVKKRVIAEEMLAVNSNGDLYDYKFFCFNGKVRFFKIDFGRFTHHRANYYSIDGKLLPYGEECCPPDPMAKIEIPSNIKSMIKVAEKLAENISFVRVDLYNIKGKIYFGELTFYPASGLSKWTSPEWDKEIGEMLSISDNLEIK